MRRGGEAPRVAGRRLGRVDTAAAAPVVVRRQVGQAQEERRLGIAEVAERARRQLVGLVAPRAHDAAVLVQDVAAVVVGGGIDHRVPLVPARRHLPRPGGAVAVEVLADVGRLVAGALQPDRKRLAGVEPVVAAPRRAVVQHPVVVRVLPGQERRARRTAERKRGEAAGEPGTGSHHQPAHRGQDGHLVHALVVGHDHDDVRPLDSLLVRVAAGRRQQRGQRERQGAPHVSRSWCAEVKKPR